jgi:hypothetical protein
VVNILLYIVLRRDMARHGIGGLSPPKLKLTPQTNLSRKAKFVSYGLKTLASSAELHSQSIEISESVKLITGMITSMLD